ncbi:MULTISPECIES: AsmA-like C-terminal region-containing protein [Marinobacter]|uniref:AsmA family protein n=1 Tax=Marinobacter TaxID=2742 RepID=UPI0012492D9C|nr:MULTISPECIES: AsmA-like C-terminal region-containing protein [Marinobacter]MBL3558149.1 AsmA family protein [Marinobacter sp. JB05H06]
MVGGVRERRLRIGLVVVLVVAALAVVATLALWWLVDTEQARKRLEAELTETLGLDVEIGQALQFGIVQGPSVTIPGLEVSRDGQVVATAESVRVGFSASRLLVGDIHPTDLHIKRPELLVERTPSGEFNVYKPQPGELNELTLQRLRVSDAQLTYRDQTTEMKWQGEKCNLDLRNIRHKGGELAQVLETLAAGGELQCHAVSQERFSMSELSVTARGEKGVFELDPVTAQALEGKLSGRAEVDVSSQTPAIQLENKLTGFDFGAFMSMLNPDQVAAGKIDLDLALNAKGSSWQELRQSASGRLDLSSGELSFDGFDLDDELEDYTDTQRFNLIDVGAIFLAGPVGLVVTRGYEFTGLLEGSGGSTTIDQMVSEWTIEDGVAQASDVAFRTPENRLALSGALSFSNYSFKDLRVAVVDSEGCAVVEQQITGPFHEPEIERPNVLVAVTGPMLDLVERGVQAITNEECETFYAGSVEHP